MSLSPEELFDRSVLIEDTQNNAQVYKVKSQKKVRFDQNLPIVIQKKDCKVLLKCASKFNKRIIDYFKLKLHTLNFKGFVFEFIPVYDEELDFYAEQNIDKFPLLIVNKEYIYGVSAILSKLNNFTKCDEQNKSIVNNESGGELHDFFMEEMKKKDDYDDEDESSNLSKRASEMMSMRKNAGQSNSSVSMANPEVHETANKRDQRSQRINTNTSTNVVDIAKSLDNGSKEANMMMKFWENQEVTEL